MTAVWVAIGCGMLASWALGFVAGRYAEAHKKTGYVGPSLIVGHVTWRCGNCRVRVSRQARFCPQCGKKGPPILDEVPS